MASIGMNFDANTVKPAESFSVIPKGDYLAMVTDSDLELTKARNGEILKLVFEIIDGEYKGRKIFSNINISNQNQQAQEIGQRQLSSLCHAVNVLSLTDSNQLHNIPVIIDVKISPAKDGYEEKNDIRNYKAANGVQAPKTTTTTTTAQTSGAAGAAPTKKPWEK